MDPIVSILLVLVGILTGAGTQLFISRRQQANEKQRLGLESSKLELEQGKLEHERRKMLYGSVPILAGGEPPNVETPNVFDNEYKAYLAVIDKEEGRETKRVYGIDTLSAEKRLAALATEHMQLAASLWSSSRIPDEYRSAYHYQLAGYCLAKASSPQLAGWQYHFAGHKFRSVSELDRAAECYVLSAEQFKGSTHQNAPSLVKRSARRASACWRQVEEHERADANARQFDIEFK